MSLPRIKPWFSKEDYEKIKNLIPEDENIPNFYNEWLSLAQEEEKKYTKSEKIKKVIIKADEYVSWCRSAGLECNYTTIGAFAVQKSQKES